jgi:hypothetical protein
MEVYVPLLQKKISGISNKMFTDRKRIRKDGLISRKFPVVPQSGIQLRRGRSLEIFYTSWISGALKIIQLMEGVV